MNKKRCEWCTSDPIYVDYHDNEWGRPIHDDRQLFELLILEGAQAGLSWLTVLKKRENYRKAFDQFNPELIAQYDEERFQTLMNNAGIIRNRLKIQSTISNALAYLDLVESGTSFSDFLWNFVDGEPIKNHFKCLTEIPTSTERSDKMSKELKKRGFRFVGTTICYAFMQAAGMVDDHTVDCFLYA